MPATKLIYGVGRIPKANEFALGEIIVNVDDSKVYSKNKQNQVFEIGGGGNTTIEGDTIVTSTAGFTTASIQSSGFFTSGDSSNLIISGGTGISLTTGSNNQIIITATSDAEVTNAINADTASYVEIAQSASYINTSIIDGDLFQFSNDGDQGGIIFSENNVNIFSNVGAFAVGLGETDNVIFNTITASSGITSSGDIFAKRLRLSSGQDTNVAGIIFDEQAGNSGFIYDDGSSMHLGYNDVDIITVSSSNDFKLLVGGGLRVASGRLKVEGNITASSPVPGQGNISASGLLYASASQPTTHTDSIFAVVYDTGSGRFYYTGSYGAGGGGADSDWFIDTNRLTSSLDVYVDGDITSSGDIVVSDKLKKDATNYLSFTEAGANTLRFITNGTKTLDLKNDLVHVNPLNANLDFRVDGDNYDNLIYVEALTDRVGIGYNSPPEKLSVSGSIFAKNSVLIGNAPGSPKIQFNKSVNANSATTAEVSILADASSYKQSLNFINVVGGVGSDRYSTFTIGSNEYFRADFNNGAKDDKAFIINRNNNSVDFIVSGSDFQNEKGLFVVAVDSNNVGVGYGSSSLSATYGDYKLAVSGNLYTNGYLQLTSSDNTAVVGGLMYSSSNEFYLGFS